MRAPFAVLAGLALLGGARLEHGVIERPLGIETPWAPSQAMAPYVSLGYREAAADWFWIRLRAYVGGDHADAPGGRALLDAVLALDPDFEQVYEFAPVTVSWVDGGPTRDDLLWVAHVLDQGVERFPDRWQIFKLAGETYLLDLTEKAQSDFEKAEWTEKGLALIERGLRLPGAPRNLATLVAQERTKLGQHDRAISGLIELINATDDEASRKNLQRKLADLEGADAERIIDEEDWAKEHVETAWRRALPEAPVSMYLLLGDPPKPYIDFADLASPPNPAEEEREALEQAVGD
jgi:hypothetical protein